MVGWIGLVYSVYSLPSFVLFSAWEDLVERVIFIREAIPWAVALGLMQLFEASFLLNDTYVWYMVGQKRRVSLLG